MMRRASVAVVLMILTSADPAAAEKFHHPEGPFVPQHNCTCRFKGEDVRLGDRRCLETPDGPKTAICVMEQNVTSWRVGRDSCPQAMLAVPGE